jgi:ubiquitin carboxyl-terminal hydrolase 6/32
MYAMVCHSGALGGGHYVSYSKNEAGTWFCHNDSACKEVPEAGIDKSTAYILLYEREGLSLSGTVRTVIEESWPVFHPKRGNYILLWNWN